jgi:autotransporter-associated beta strand protein
MWSDPVSTTPSIIQTNFGQYGQNIPGDGQTYCGPTAAVMSIFWLAANGFTQFAPKPYGGQNDPQTTNLERVIAGLMGTTPNGGTGWVGMLQGITTYFAACGIGTGQYVFDGVPNPDPDWFAARLAPNTEPSPDTIVLANFSVGWYCLESANYLAADGGHYLTPLSVGDGTVTLNNPYPPSFEDVENGAGWNPQTVQVVQLPPGKTLLPPPNGFPLPSEYFCTVVTPYLQDSGLWAVLSGGNTWSVSTSALPSSADYAPATWEITAPQTINTNGGTLTVLAPLAGSGGIMKRGRGTLLLSSANELTGDNVVSAGLLKSEQATAQPFGTGAVTLENGGGLWLAAQNDVTLASGKGARLNIEGGGGSITFAGDSEFFATIGGDETGSSITRTNRGSLILALDAGLAVLGSGFQVFVFDNDPPLSGNIVAPYILGQDAQAGWAKFLAYSDGGFLTAKTDNVDINEAPSDCVYQVVDVQTINSGGTVHVAALEVDNYPPNVGSVTGINTTIEVGGQSSGDSAGVILNNANVLNSTAIQTRVEFGEAEGIIYTGQPGASINGVISGRGGLTVIGPGTLTLTGNNTSLTGAVYVNSGTLVSACSNSQGSATGSGDITVMSPATLELKCAVPGDIIAYGTVWLNGGTVNGNLMISADGDATPHSPGGILQGIGTIAGPATVNGVVQSGPGPQPGMLEFRHAATIAGASFYWRPQALVDITDSGPGKGWNAVQFDGYGRFGTPSQPLHFFLDFSLLEGDPDNAGNGTDFWKYPHTWPVVTFNPDSSFYWFWDFGNVLYATGTFTLVQNGSEVDLQWAPAGYPQRWAHRQKASAQRHIAHAVYR